MPRSPRHLQTVAGAVVFSTGLALAMYFSGRFVYERTLRSQAVDARILLEQRAQALEQRIDRYRIMPAVLSSDPQLQAALLAPADDEQHRRASERLVRLNFASHTSTLTLIDRNGMAIAASNWQEPGSNVGHDYRFRPYFQQAMAHDNGEFYGIGVTTGKPGHFIARAIRDPQGRAIGAIAVKVELEGLQDDWRDTRDVVLLSDRNGIVFLSNRSQWRYRALAPLTPVQRALLQRTRQYVDEPLTPLAVEAERTSAGTRLARVRNVSPDRQLWQSLPLPKEGWTLHVLRSTAPSVRAGWIARGVAAGAWLLLAALVLLLWQRHRITQLRLRSRRELEQLVEQHAKALRTAQDGIVQAAQASIGESRSLEHLPQGISVVDRQLRLVAWNRRYAELFRYPTELLQVGRPIEDLIRYNVRRGLLGDTDPEEAVRKRLEHLQRGQPYLHERERADGTVIEIRGNTLPEGGFVTSYADITTYRQSARELRTLADSLEKRIAQRTADLNEAKAEAERANRSKTRFVAAAVHDLLQPVNAARMYLSSLRRRLDNDGRELTDHIDAALSAQDDILSSLLDISRLESGALEVNRSVFPLARLFAAIETQFRLLAESRGLRLRVMPTHATIDSDEVLLRRVVQNLVSNALQFTSAGGRVTLGARRTRDGMRIEVHDTGPGIPDSKREVIFEEFQRLDGGTERTASRGAGLGLAIVRRIADLLHHRIGVRSRLGVGSVFTIDVPRGDAASAPLTPAKAKGDDAPLQGRRVWVIDDDAASRDAARHLLCEWGCTTNDAAGITDALRMARTEGIPDLILLDYRLGNDDGFALASQLQSIWGALPAVILMSADTDPSLRERAGERGWNFLPKPMRPAALRALMARLLPLR